MKKEIRQIILIVGIAWGGIAQSQIRIANSATNIAVSGSSAFIDASSNPTYNSSTNVGKGLLYPRVDLTTFTSFGGVPIGIPTSFPTYYDGFVVYNTNVGGVAGVGTTQGTLTSGFWYYDNKSGTINGGTWKPLSPAAASTPTTNTLTSTANILTSTINGVTASAPVINTNALSLSGSSLSSTVNGVVSNVVNLAPAIAAATTNVLTLSGSSLTSTVNGAASTVNLAPAITAATTHTLVSGGTGNNTITSTVNGVTASTTAVKTVSNTSSGNTLSTTVNGITGTTVPIINSNTLTLSGSSLTSTVNGISSTAVNLAPAITAATTNVLNSSGNTMTSTVNGVTDTAPIINSVTNTVSGNTLTTTVNGIPSSAVTLPQGVNIYNSDGTLLAYRTVSMNKNPLVLSQDTNNNIRFDVGSTVTGVSRILSEGSVSSLIRAAVGTIAAGYHTLDMEILSDGKARLLSGDNTELLIGTSTNSAPLIFAAGNQRAVLTGTGNFGIGTSTPSQRLDVAGNIKASGSLISGTTTYPDYVFEGYYKGFSKINPAYQFRKLDEVESFIKEKGHLPGYQSLEEVKQKDMAVDITQNSITNMEKIEELYLHVIELNKKIKSLEEKNVELEKLVLQGK